MGQIPSHPILTPDDAKRHEAELFGDDEKQEWAAMQCAGNAVGHAVLRDFAEIGPFPREAHLLVLAGKGHNGGDALLAAKSILERHPSARADVWLFFGERALRPHAASAFRELVQSSPGRVNRVGRFNASDGGRVPSPATSGSLAASYDVMLDGVFGFQFRPPLALAQAGIFERLNAWPVRFRAAVDLPSGIGAAGALRADFTYATGSVKSPAVDDAQHGVVGRLRYLDLGFFEVGRDRWARRSDEVERNVPVSCGSAGPPRPTIDLTDSADRVLTSAVLAPLRTLRPAASDKRTYGHLFILGGSRSYPGAVLMSALAAARSGVGLITAFVPESLVSAFAARLPEVMWVGWPEAPGGGLSLEGSYLLRERIDRATAILLGPGVGREPETLAMLADVVKTASVPLVIDADALQPEIVRSGSAPRVLTPHAGEFARVVGVAGVADPGPASAIRLSSRQARPATTDALREFSRATKAVTVLKGPLTRISDGGAVYHSCCGGPVLARGGSGDLLAGLIGGLLAQNPGEPLAAACRGAVWHGLAADRLAREQGQVAVQTTQLIDHLGAVLRETE